MFLKFLIICKTNKIDFLSEHSIYTVLMSEEGNLATQSCGHRQMLLENELFFERLEYPPI